MTIPPELAELASDFIARNLALITDIAKGIWSGSKQNIKLKLKNTYGTYLKHASERFGMSKSFFIRSSPTNIYDFYVPLGVTCGETKLGSVSISEIEAVTKRAVVTGTAGSGKSMLMRHLFLSALSDGQRVPVFVELRSFAESDGQPTVSELIVTSLEAFGFDLGEEFVERATKRGHFVFLFDGLDEVPASDRRKISREITSLSARARDCMIILSSRPDDSFSNWNEFSDLRVNPLSLDDACKLVQKLPHDEDVKTKFIADLRESLFSSHTSFLSNPLLLSIMLLTYGQNAEIPSKLSLFYDQAYEALFQKHDALKGGFQRDRRTDIDIQDFARIFSAYCLVTYDQHKYRTSRSECLGHLDKAKTQVHIDVSSDDFLDDCLQAVCLLVEDALQISFAHRSFQEYFVARFIIDAAPDIQRNLLKRFRDRIQTDSIFKLLLEMNRDFCEREFLLPELEALFKKIKVKRNVGITHYLRFLQETFSYMRIPAPDTPDRRGPYFKGASRHIFVDLVSFTNSDAIGHLPGSSNPSRRHSATYWEEFILRYGSETEDKMYKFEELTIHSPVIRELAEGPFFGAMRHLEAAYVHFKYLKSKHKDSMRSLDNLLG